MRVNVRRMSTGVAAVSTLVVTTGGSSLGCAPEEPLEQEPLEQEELGTAADALSAGSARLELGLGGGPKQALNFNLSAATMDEFVRVGQVLSFTLPAWVLWETLSPNVLMPDEDTLKQKLRATVKVYFYDKNTKIGSRSLSIGAWANTLYGLQATTGAFTVPAKVDRLTFSVTVREATNPTARVTVLPESINGVVVYGGDLPNKTLFFDNDFGALKQRIIEGSPLAAGAKATLLFTDWRADVIVDRSTINTQIGTATSYGRFGSTQVPIFGKIVHEVSYGVFYDDGQGWQSEKALTPNAQSILGSGRTNFEAVETIPAAAKDMQLYFHVKTYLVADYSGHSNITQKWYGDGDRILMRDKYDNPNGPSTNYDFPLQ